MSVINIREATPSDADFIALIVCMALDRDATHPLYNVFKSLAARDDTQYSYLNTLIAQTDGLSIGAIVGYDGQQLHKLREPLYAMMRQTLGEVIEIEDETQAGEFYIDSLAVLKEHRSQGIGKKLLTALCDKAFATGFERVGLLVDFEKPKVQAVYSSLGFERINETTFLGHPMWHMQKKLK